MSTADLAAAGRRSDVGAKEDEALLDDEQVEAEENFESTSDEQLRAAHVESDSGTRHGEARELERPPPRAARADEEALVALFTPELTETYRSRWVSIQSSFVDDPKRAVRSGDELVAQVMTDLANSFAEERHRVEAQLDATGEGSTENLRVALRRYRSFFDRLLSL